MNLSTKEKKILRILFVASEGLYYYSLYSKALLSISDLSKSLDILTDQKFIEDDEGRLKITKLGVEYALKSKLVIKKNSNKFDNIPKEFLGPRIEINEFYLPTISKLDEELVLNKKLGDI